MSSGYGCKSCQAVFPLAVGHELPRFCPRCRKEGHLIPVDLEALRRRREEDYEPPCVRDEPCARLSGEDCPGGWGC